MPQNLSSADQGDNEPSEFAHSLRPRILARKPQSHPTAMMAVDGDSTSHLEGPKPDPKTIMPTTTPLTCKKAAQRRTLLVSLCATIVEADYSFGRSVPPTPASDADDVEMKLRKVINAARLVLETAGSKK